MIDNKKLRTDYTYCNGDKCLHKLGCLRYPENYKDYEDCIKNTLWYISASDCINNDYNMLVRFRNSDGSNSVKNAYGELNAKLQQ